VSRTLYARVLTGNAVGQRAMNGQEVGCLGGHLKPEAARLKQVAEPTAHPCSLSRQGDDCGGRRGRIEATRDLNLPKISGSQPAKLCRLYVRPKNTVCSGVADMSAFLRRCLP
jgi:hypothetical protein